MKKNLLLLVINFFVGYCMFAQKDSICRTYYKDGNIFSFGKKLNGLMQGEWKYYDDSLGYLKKIINFKDNLYHGVYIEYHKNAKIKTVGYYDRNFISNEIIANGFTVTNAIRIGSWDYFNEKEQLIKTEIYDCSGKIIKVLPQK